MGCEIIVGGAAPSELHAIEELFAERDRRFSRFRDDSELNRVNGTAAPFLVSEEFASALDVALEAAAASDGLVDPTLGAAVVAAGYDRDFADLDEQAEPRPRPHASPRRRSAQRRPTTPPSWLRQPNARWARSASSTPRATDKRRNADAREVSGQRLEVSGLSKRYGRVVAVKRRRPARRARRHLRLFFDRRWKPVQKSIGIEPLRDLYDLRHTSQPSRSVRRGVQ